MRLEMIQQGQVFKLKTIDQERAAVAALG